MKLLDYPYFAGLKACMQSAGGSQENLAVFLNCFSLKTTETETRLYKQLERATRESTDRRRERTLSFSSLPPLPGDQSPVRHHMDMSAAEPLPQALSAAAPALDIKTLCHLISVLNTSFPDFDFA